MQRYDVHLCTVSQQPLPNLIPVIQESTRPKEVVLLVSDDMRDRVDSLEAMLLSHGCKVTVLPSTPYDIEALRDQALTLLSEREGQSVAFNATCGTKIMALGVYEIFRHENMPVFYVDTEHNRIITLTPQRAEIPLPDLVTVKSYLAAYGYTLCDNASHRVLPSRKDLGATLLKKAGKWGQAMLVLNLLAIKAQKTLCATLDKSLTGETDALLQLLAEAGLLSIDNYRVIFADESARYFCNGGWLEEHLLAQVNRLKGEKLVRDHLANAVVSRQGNPQVKNEIDLALTARSRLHLIECKTKRMSDKPGKEARVDDIVYKLDNLRDLMGGTFGKAMLISYHQLKPEDRNRCRENKIDVIEGEQLGELSSRLKNWIVR